MHNFQSQQNDPAGTLKTLSYAQRKFHIKQAFDRVRRVREASGQINQIDKNKWIKYGIKALEDSEVNKTLSFIRMAQSELCMNFRGKVIVDAGCGLGNYSIAFSLFDAKKVYGVDIDVGGLSFISEALKISKEFSNIELILSDIMNFSPHEKVDMVFCNEMLSHLYDRPKFYRHISAILKSGGKLFASDDNNGAKLRAVDQRFKLWLKTESPGGRIYELRKKYIKDRFPEITDQHLETITKNSSCLIPAEIDLVARGIKPGQEYQISKAPYDPEYCWLPNEDLLYPDEEKQRITAAGMTPEIIPYFMGGKRAYLQPINRMLTLLLPLKYARAVHIIASKD